MAPSAGEEIIRHLVQIAAQQERLTERLTTALEHRRATLTRLEPWLARPPAATTRRVRPKKRQPRAATATDITPPAFDSARHVLGTLCPWGHAHHGTGQSLLQRSNHKGVLCHREQARTRRQAQRLRREAGHRPQTTTRR